MLRTAQSPKTAEQYTNEGNTFFQQSRFQEATNCYEASLKLRPNHALTLSNYGVALHKLDRLEEAKENQERSIKIDPKNLNAHRNLAFVYQDIGLRHAQPAMAKLHFAAAEVSYKKSLPESPTMEELCQFGDFLRSMKDYDKAQFIYFQVLQTNPTNLQALYNLSRVYLSMALEAQEPEKSRYIAAAFENVKVGLKHYPNDPDLLSHQGALFCANQQYHEAVEVLIRCLNRPAALNNLAVAYHGLENYDAAVNTCEECLRLDPNYNDAKSSIVPSLKKLAVSYFTKKQYEKAAIAFKRILDFRPNDAETHGNLGAAYDGLKQYGDAIRSYERCLKLNPNHATTKENLARLQAKGLTTNTVATHLQPASSQSIHTASTLPGQIVKTQEPDERKESVSTQNPGMHHQYDQHRQQQTTNHTTSASNTHAAKTPSSCCSIL